jgi:hypothetical protein
VACPLEARIVTAVARERLSSRHVFNSTDTHAAIELLAAVFCVRAVQRLYNEERSTSTGQGEARYKKYKRLKLGGGQAYDGSSE